jgi:hypothetical protein
MAHAIEIVSPTGTVAPPFLFAHGANPEQTRSPKTGCFRIANHRLKLRRDAWDGVHLPNRTPHRSLAAYLFMHRPPSQHCYVAFSALLFGQYWCDLLFLPLMALFRWCWCNLARRADHRFLKRSWWRTVLLRCRTQRRIKRVARFWLFRYTNNIALAALNCKQVH